MYYLGSEEILKFLKIVNLFRAEIVILTINVLKPYQIHQFLQKLVVHLSPENALAISVGNACLGKF